MSIAISLLNTNVSATTVTSLASGSVSPTANALLVVIVRTLAGAGTSVTHDSISTTLSGGLSFTKQVEVEQNYNSRRNNISIWTAQLGATPGTGTVTGNWSLSTIRNAIEVLEVTDYETSGPVVQIGNNENATTPLTITLGSSPAATSLVLAAINDSGPVSDPNIAPDASYTQLAEYNTAGSTVRGYAHTQYDVGADTTVEWTSLDSVNNVAAAIEIAEAGGGGGTTYYETPAGSITPAGAAAKQTGKPVSGSVSSAGIITRMINKVVAGLMSIAGSPVTYTDGYLGDTFTAQDALMAETWHQYNGGQHGEFQFSTNQRALLRFILEDIPDGAECTSATLYIYHNYAPEGGGTVTITVYEISDANGSWIPGTGNIDIALEDENCWDALRADGSEGVKDAWAGSAGLSTAGTDYKTPAIGSFSFNGGSAQGTEFTCSLDTDTVAAWFGQASNNGIIMWPNSNSGHAAQSENGTTAYRPKLVVQYTLPGHSLVGVLATQLLTILQQAAGGTLSLAGAVVRGTGKAVAGSVGSAGSLVRSIQRALSGGLSSAGTLARQARKVLAGALSSAGGLVGDLIHGLFEQAAGGTLGLAGSISRQAGKSLSGALSSAGGLVRSISKIVAGGLSSAGTLAKQAGKVLAGALSSLGELATSLIHGLFTQDAGGSLGLAGVINRQTGKAAGGSLTSAGSLARTVGKILTGAMSGAGGLATNLIHGIIEQAVGGALSLAGAINKRIDKSPQGILSISGAVGKRVLKAIAGALTFMATAAGVLIGMPVPDRRTVAINAEDRITAMTGEDRTVAVPSEDRIYAIGGDDGS